MASYSLFFHDAPLIKGEEIWLDEDTARHIVQVLRMQPGEKIQLTDGKGHVAIASVAQTGKKKCSVLVEAVTSHREKTPSLHLAVAFTKNTSRNEWLLEKATELGVTTIIPLLATRSERERIRHDRWKNILMSAILQSQQYHLPELTDLQTLKQVLQTYAAVPQKLIGHCITEHERFPISKILLPKKETLILIGPEGDFTEDEVKECIGANFAGISMGTTRLRTETAAMAACACFNLVNDEE
jgi:16S rRNA (uracil1498-N3)-methyltransferase